MLANRAGHTSVTSGEEEKLFNVLSPTFSFQFLQTYCQIQSMGSGQARVPFLCST